MIRTLAPLTLLLACAAGRSQAASFPVAGDWNFQGSLSVQGTPIATMIQNAVASVAQALPVAIGTVNTVPAGTAARITSTSTASATLLNFWLPQGATGAAGPAGGTGSTGASPTLSIGTVATSAPGSAAAVTDNVNGLVNTLSFTLPQGATGAAGAAGPAGSAGPAGASPTVSIGTVTTGAPGSAAAVSDSVNGLVNTLVFSLPQGAAGATGSAGPAGGTPTLAIGSVTTGTAGSAAAVSDSVNGLAHTLSFTIPQGTPGASGAVATSTTAGSVLPDGSTIALGSNGQINATAQVPVLGPFSASRRTLCQRANDVVNVLDYGATGIGYGQTIGTAYGTTLAAIAAYSVTDCNGNAVQPFAWLLDGNYHGGVAWSEQFTPAQDWTELEIATAAAASGSTAVSVSNPLGIVAGETIYDGVLNALVGKVASVSGNVINTAAGLTAAIQAGDDLVVQIATTATAAGSTNSATLTVANSFAGSANGLSVWDSTQGKVVGVVSGINGATGLTLAANAAVAVASGDNLNFYNPLLLSGLTTTTRTGPAGQSGRYALWNDPGHASFYPQVGDLISDVSNATPCLPANDTITAIDGTPTDANYGQITLAAASTYDCPYDTTFHVVISDAMAQQLDPDWLALQSAFYAAAQGNGNANAQGGGRTDRTVQLPDLELFPQRPLFAYSYNSNAGQHITIQGRGGVSVLDPYTDFGWGKCAISSGSNGGISQYGVGVRYRDFTLEGPNQNSGVGTNPATDEGICLGAGDSADNVTVNGFHGGFGILADHQHITNSTATNNYYGIYFMPNTPTMGNQVFENDILVANRMASFGIAASDQFDSGTVLDVHVGFGPYGWLNEAAGPFDPWPGYYVFLSNDTIIDNWWEATGNGAIVDLSGKGGLDQNTFIGAQNNNDTQYPSEALPGTAAATIKVANFTHNRFIGGSMLNDYGHVSTAIVDATGTCAGNTFFGADSFLTQSSTAKPAMICGADGGGNSFTGQFQGSFYMAGANLYAGQAASLNGSARAVAYSSSGAYLGSAITGASSGIAGEMIPVVRSGTRVPFQFDPSQTAQTIAAGTSLTATTDGYFGVNGGGLGTQVGVVVVGAGSGQIGQADLTR